MWQTQTPVLAHIAKTAIRTAFQAKQMTKIVEMHATSQQAITNASQRIQMHLQPSREVISMVATERSHMDQVMHA